MTEQMYGIRRSQYHEAMEILESNANDAYFEREWPDIQHVLQSLRAYSADTPTHWVMVLLDEESVEYLAEHLEHIEVREAA